MKYALLVVLLIGSCKEKESLATGMEGKPLPSFSLLLADSSTYLDTKDIAAGKPAVFFFFSPHCPYCRAQIKDMVASEPELKDIPLYIITTFPFREMKKFAEDYQLSEYANITVARDYKGFFPEHFNIKTIPYTAIYDKEKRLTRAFSGKISGEKIRNTIEN